MAVKFFQPKFVLVALVLLVSWSKQLEVSANPLPDNETIEKAKNNVNDFWDRTKNTFSVEDKGGEKLTTTEIVLIGVAIFVVFMFLLCCIGYCLCECIKELVCCICCCSWCRN